MCNSDCDVDVRVWAHSREGARLTLALWNLGLVRGTFSQRMGSFEDYDQHLWVLQKVQFFYHAVIVWFHLCRHPSNPNDLHGNSTPSGKEDNKHNYAGLYFVSASYHSLSQESTQICIFSCWDAQFNNIMLVSSTAPPGYSKKVHFSVSTNALRNINTQYNKPYWLLRWFSPHNHDRAQCRFQCPEQYGVSQIT